MMPAMTLRELVTTVLDAMALCLIAAGVGAGCARWIGWWGMAVSGVVLLAGSLLAARGRP